MSSESTTATNLLSETEGVGHVLVTSQAPLSELDPSWSSFKLEPFTTDNSVDLLRHMNLFSKKVLDVANVDETMLKNQIEAVVSTFGSQLPKHFTRLTYTTPPANEKAKAKKERQQQLRIGLHEHQELMRPEFRTFLKESGNLPLVISLYGHMFRADDQITTTLQLIEQIRKIELSDVDKSGRNALTDKHYFGMVKSIKFMLQRLKTNAEFTEHEREDAFALLTAMSMLDRTQTPLSLFLDHDLDQPISSTVDEQTLTAQISQFAGLDYLKSSYKWVRSVVINYFSWMWSPPWLPSTVTIVAGHDCASVFRERANLERARDVLCEVGILRPSADTTKFIGVMHQLVQRCVRDQLVHRLDVHLLYMSAHTIITMVRQMLQHRIHFTRSPQINRDVVPCVAAWCAAVLPMTTHSSFSNMNRVKVFANDLANDLALLSNLGNFIRNLQGDVQHALTIHERVRALSKMLPQGHPGIAASMHDLACTFSCLGRHNDALKLNQQALEFRKRVLPLNCLDIARSMNNLAVTFSDLGRHDDALKLKEAVFEFRTRVLPQDNRAIATSMGNLASTFSDLGRHADALKLQQEVLEFHKRVLPQDHPLIATSMDNLASTFSNLGRHSDALKLKEEVLEFRKRVLPHDHPDIAASMHNVAGTFSDLGRHADAVKLQQEVLEFVKRVLPQDHPRSAISMNNLAMTFSSLGRYDDALKLQQESVESLKRVLPQDHPDIASSMSNLATTFSHLGRHDNALELLQEVLEFQERVLPQDHPDVAISMHNVASTFSNLGRHDDALKLKEEVLELFKRVLPQDHPSIATSMNNLASTFSDLGRHDDALKLYREVLEFQKRVLPQDHPDIAISMSNLALTFSGLDRHDDALKLEGEALEFQKQVLPQDHPHIAASMGKLGCLYFVLGNLEEALTHTHSAIKIHQRCRPPDKTAIANLNELVKQIHSNAQQQVIQLSQSCTNTTCFNPTCRKPNPPRTCSRCGVAKYCDQTCQRSHWKTHQRNCNPK